MAQIEIGSRVSVRVWDGRGNCAWADGTVTGDDYGSDDKGWSWGVRLDQPMFGKTNICVRSSPDRIRPLCHPSVIQTDS